MTPSTPTMLRLEAMGACQLKCRSCPTADGSIRPTIGPGYLRYERFRELLAANPQLRSIELSSYGEAFLNPDLSEILRHADERGVALTIANGANLNNVRPEALEAVVRYRLRVLTCSIDGASQSTYATYRVKGNLETVLENVRRIVELKHSLRSPYPVLVWQFIVFGHNEHDLPAARRMAEELGMIFKPKISWDPEFSPIRDPAFVHRETGLPTTRDALKRETGNDYSRSICYQLWNEPQINWDGKVLGCCRNFWGDFGGNVFEDGLRGALDHPRMRHAKEMLTGERPPHPEVPCTTCDVYRGIVADRRFISRLELRRNALWRRVTAVGVRNPRLLRGLRAAYQRSGAKRIVRVLTSAAALAPRRSR